MGTNYYLHRYQQIRAFGHLITLPTEREPLHIGKSSAGWCFALHVYPDDNALPQSLDDWRDLFKTGTIRDEYGCECTRSSMVSVISDRHRTTNAWTPADYARNDAQPGPRGLIRHKIGRLCIAHGEGTYDLLAGDFS